MARINSLAAATAVAAAFSLLATPVAATDLPAPARQAVVFDAHALDAQRDRYRGRHHYDDDDWDIDAGDVIAGVAILGVIAAIASAAGSSNQQQDTYPEPQPYPDDDYGYRQPSASDDDYGYQQPSGVSDRYASAGISGAVDACVAEVEQRGQRIGTVAGANRDGQGWYVSGELDNGSMYWCRLDDNGAVSEVGGSGIGYADPADQPSYEDTYYGAANEGELDKLQYSGG